MFIADPNSFYEDAKKCAISYLKRSGYKMSQPHLFDISKLASSSANVFVFQLNLAINRYLVSPERH